jgi:hypothetical protein
VGWTGLHDFDETVDVIPESDPENKSPTAGLLSKQVFLYCEIKVNILRYSEFLLDEMCQISINTFIGGSSGYRHEVI